MKVWIELKAEGSALFVWQSLSILLIRRKINLTDLLEWNFDRSHLQLMVLFFWVFYECIISQKEVNTWIFYCILVKELLRILMNRHDVLWQYD